jgi:hypothetical protein
MWDYSLENVRTRPANVGDKLTICSFGTGTRGFGAPEDPTIAVCLMPGTELAIAKTIDNDSSLRRKRDLLLSISGVGETLAGVVLAELPGPDMLRSSAKVVAYERIKFARFPRAALQSVTVRFRTATSWSRMIVSAHSALIPNSLIIGHHFSISAF